MDSSLRKIEKRNRPPVSCEPCRARKLKCNRGLPCDACVRRDKSSLCHYAANASRSKPTSSRPRDIRDRLVVLENLVSSFVSGNAVIQPGPTPQGDLATEDDDGLHTPDSLTTLRRSSAGDDALTPETLHLQETGDGQVNYVDPSHWLSILDDIKEVREQLSAPSRGLSHRDTGFDMDRNADASLLFRFSHNLSIDEILTSLPSQPICDMLLAWYFNSRFVIIGIVHPAKFQNEYAAFWESPSTAPPLWTALLFAVIGVAAILRRISSIKEPVGSVPPVKILQQRTVQCLVLGQYATGNAHALEAFLLHLQSCHFTNGTFSSGDFSVDPWFQMGTIIRLAFRMGYHRDPSKLAGISAFDGEMRRRVWINIFQIDTLMSFEMGFPSMIPTEFCDTEPPRNLEYSDFHVGMATLPPSRPDSEYTPTLYTIFKSTIMAVFKRIVAHTQSLSVPSYERTIELDSEMKQAYIKVPEPLQRRDVNRSFIDHSSLIWQRCTIEVLYLKGLVVLHRRYISYELQSPTFELSRRACVEAALGILDRHEDIHRACEFGGRLYEDRWIFSSLPVHHFLMAAMVVCLDLSVSMRSRWGVSAVGSDYQQLARREYRALQSTQRILASKGADSEDARIAVLSLDLMLKKVAENNVAILLPDEGPSGDTHLAVESELPYASAMSQMIDGPESIDWGLLDQYFQNVDTSAPDTAI